MIRITGVRWTGVHPFKQFENRLARTGRNEHTARRAVSLDKSLRLVDSQWVLVVQRVLLAVLLASRAAECGAKYTATANSSL
jgi:hypothetical protein